MMKDEWLRAALTDDAVVVELLFRLKGASSEASMPSMPSLPPVSWGLRLPRSKLANTFKKDSTTTTTTTITTTRCSPTTPLSWSGGAAASLSDGCYDDSSASRASSDPSRSKGTFTSGVTNICSTNKRSKRKKTFSELREEETILLNERIHLKRELASVHVTLEEQRVRSKNLKRIKVDLNLQSGETCATSGEAEAVVPNQCNGIEASTVDRSQAVLPRHATTDECTFSSSCIVQEDVDTNKRCFVLPDLNMMPTEEEVAAGIL